MDNINNISEVKDIPLDSLIPFKLRQSLQYHGERLEQLKNSIVERKGLISPITVRAIEDGKYEIICGHNRANAIKSLGHTLIRADVKYDCTDEEALGLYYDSNTNQQSFSDWNYSRKIEAITYIEKEIKKNSQQGKRTDLEENNDEEIKEGTSVQTRQKSDKNSKRTAIRDKMARRMGISTATFSKYRSIIKHSDDIVGTLATMLDNKRISFEIAYRISKLKSNEVKHLLSFLQSLPEIKPDIEKLKLLIENSKNADKELTEKEIRDTLTTATI